jgi:hypothetical protein
MLSSVAMLSSAVMLLVDMVGGCYTVGTVERICSERRCGASNMVNSIHLPVSVCILPQDAYP